MTACLTLLNLSQLFLMPVISQQIMMVYVLTRLCKQIIFFYKKRSNLLMAILNSLNGTTGISPTAEVISKATEILIRQSVLKELENKN